MEVKVELGFCRVERCGQCPFCRATVKDKEWECIASGKPLNAMLVTSRKPPSPMCRLPIRVVPV